MDFSPNLFMVTGESYYCRNSQDAVDASISSSLSCYSTREKKITSNHYSWKNPFIGEIEDVHYEKNQRIGTF